MSIQTRAAREITPYFTANPAGHVHAAIAPEHLAHRRRRTAFELHSGKQTEPGTWHMLRFAARTTELAAPITQVVDAVLGNGAYRGSVASTGHQSEAVLPSMFVAFANFSTLAGEKLGALVGAAINRSDAALAGAKAGAMFGCGVAWVANQALATVGLYCKVHILAAAACIVAFETATAPPDTAQMEFTKDTLAYVPSALGRQAKAVWKAWSGYLPNWKR